MMGLNLSVNIDNIHDFYQEADRLEDTGNERSWIEHSNRDDSDWVGLSLKEIKQSKYSYKKGLNKLKSIEEDLELGGSQKKYKFDEFEGDDMNYDRFLEQLPSLTKRIRNHGSGQGKFINLHVCICENAWCSAKSLMIRAYTVMRIVDYLENMGFRIGVSIYTDTRDVGTFKGDAIDLLHVEVLIKRPEEPLLKPLLLTAVSSWMFRHWMFKFRAAKFNVNSGMGASTTCRYENTKEDLYIGRGECLCKEDAQAKIMAIAKMFSNDEVEEED